MNQCLFESRLISTVIRAAVSEHHITAECFLPFKELTGFTSSQWKRTFTERIAHSRALDTSSTCWSSDVYPCLASTRQQPHQHLHHTSQRKFCHIAWATQSRIHMTNTAAIQTKYFLLLFWNLHDRQWQMQEGQSARCYNKSMKPLSLCVFQSGAADSVFTLVHHITSL